MLKKKVKPPCGGPPFTIRVKDESEFTERLAAITKDHERVKGKPFRGCQSCNSPPQKF